MSIEASVTGNAITLTVTFTDAHGDPVEPDGDVTWQVYDYARRPAAPPITQPKADAESVGTYRQTFTPTTVGYHYFEASATVDGDVQTERVRHWVKFTTDAA